MQLSVSCLIPAYNEAGRIGPVLEVLRACPAVDEILVIDDGSSDDTLSEAETALAGDPRARLLCQPQNGGKSRAVARGIHEARGSHLLLLDADLQGLTPEALEQLIAPVRSGRAGVSISLRRNSPWLWRAIGLDYISGERVLPRALLAPRSAEIAALPGFGLEVFMNRIWLHEGLRIAVVRWPGVDSPWKSQKLGRLAGLKADAKMMREIFALVSPPEALAQIARMRARRVARS
ncbi:glycosyltransferase [Pseudooceanicola sp. CBS1P-1]|uniref:Glycosyltransferase n=1 Tax=Pseudooceanicola albus TaxID=2692189 RepID=A0A6L7G5J5_9RHOB|nr:MULTISPECIES: glycosyltransferase family 2 protein [Pseudooceanicola]MBT9382981.1 glycosyltransferase [Pseudooceanicola endophyticus]MXN19169.1 glycosyltransferase [Pseudooceanicola albus]